jgi:hypothetical protein
MVLVAGKPSVHVPIGVPSLTVRRTAERVEQA